MARYLSFRVISQKGCEYCIGIDLLSDYAAIDFTNNFTIQSLYGALNNSGLNISDETERSNLSSTLEGAGYGSLQPNDFVWKPEVSFILRSSVGSDCRNVSEEVDPFPYSDTTEVTVIFNPNRILFDVGIWVGGSRFNGLSANQYFLGSIVSEEGDFAQVIPNVVDCAPPSGGITEQTSNGGIRITSSAVLDPTVFVQNLQTAIENIIQPALAAGQDLQSVLASIPISIAGNILTVPNNALAALIEQSFLNIFTQQNPAVDPATVVVTTSYNPLTFRYVKNPYLIFDLGSFGPTPFVPTTNDLTSLQAFLDLYAWATANAGSTGKISNIIPSPDFTDIQGTVLAGYRNEFNVNITGAGNILTLTETTNLFIITLDLNNNNNGTIVQVATTPVTNPLTYKGPIDFTFGSIEEITVNPTIVVKRPSKIGFYLVLGLLFFVLLELLFDLL